MLEVTTLRTACTLPSAEYGGVVRKGLPSPRSAIYNWQSYPIGQLPKSVMDTLPTRAIQAKGIPLIILTPAEFITRQRLVSE